MWKRRNYHRVAALIKNIACIHILKSRLPSFKENNPATVSLTASPIASETDFVASNGGAAVLIPACRSAKIRIYGCFRNVPHDRSAHYLSVLHVEQYKNRSRKSPKEGFRPRSEFHKFCCQKRYPRSGNTSSPLRVSARSVFRPRCHFRGQHCVPSQNR